MRPMRSARSPGDIFLADEGVGDREGAAEPLSSPSTHRFKVSNTITLTRSFTTATGSVLPIASRILRSGMPVISDARFGVTAIGARTPSSFGLALMEDITQG